MILVNDYVIERLSSSGTFSKKSILAIDAHDIMYYGDPAAEGVVGTKPRKGSHWAYEFATISVLLDGERVTLAAVPTLRGPMVWHVRALIEHALSLGIKPWLILLDGAYNSSDVINYLNEINVKYIIRIAPPIDGIRPGDDFIYRSRGHRRREDEQATFRIVALNGRDKGGNVRLFVFATNTNIKPARVRRLFRKRWGIETSYRMINKFLARTKSKLYSVRRLYFYLAILMYNMWVALKHSQGSVIADSLKLYAMMTLVMSFIPDAEQGGVIK